MSRRALDFCVKAVPQQKLSSRGDALPRSEEMRMRHPPEVGKHEDITRLKAVHHTLMYSGPRQGWQRPCCSCQRCVRASAARRVAGSCGRYCACHAASGDPGHLAGWCASREPVGQGAVARSRAGSRYVTVSSGREEGVVEESVEGGVRMSTGSSGSRLTSGWPVRWCTLRGWCLLRL